MAGEDGRERSDGGLNMSSTMFLSVISMANALYVYSCCIPGFKPLIPISSQVYSMGYSASIMAEQAD